MCDKLFLYFDRIMILKDISISIGLKDNMNSPYTITRYIDESRLQQI